MLDDRKAAILCAVVEEYIRTAQPVGSGHVADAPSITVSPATIRNDMVALEADGYLQQPHTSAGRVPTEKGYRFFVDALASPSLDRTSARRVRSFFDEAHGEIEQMLADTTRLLSGLTDYAAVVIGPAREQAPVRSVQLVGLNDEVALLVIVLASGAIEKCAIDVPAGTDEATLTAATAHLAGHVVGSPVAALGDLPAAVDPSVDAVAQAAARAGIGVDEAEEDQVFVGGAAQMASAFDAVDTVRSVLTILEQQLVVVTLLRDVIDRGLSVAIGTETGVQPLAECSLVVAPYEVGGRLHGTIGVLGPTRMNYPQALAAVAVVSQNLGNRLTEG